MSKTYTTTNCTHEASKNKSISTSTAESSHLHEAGMCIPIQDDLIRIASTTRDSNLTKDSFGIVAKTNETMKPVDPVIIYAKSNDHDPKVKQVWLAKVHEAILPHKLSILANVDEVTDTTLSEDFDVTENFGRKIDRQSEWLVAVRSSVQNYKEQTP